jgi:BMFP domain-containing protein YqiC
MLSVAQKLATKLDEWKPEVSREVESLVADIIELADINALDLVRSRRVEQDVLDLLDAPIAR